MSLESTASAGRGVPAASSREPSVIAARRRLRVLFINDTSRNGGPGRSLFYILKFLDPEVIYRVALIPRSGIVSDLLRDGGVVEETIFEPRLIENLVEPWSRAIRREDFDAPLGIKAVRA